ncbi:MAG: hypothetical protein ACL7AX_12220, partial [Candidatus Arsenophonus phytopathogenicus]
DNIIVGMLKEGDDFKKLFSIIKILIIIILNEILDIFHKYNFSCFFMLKNAKINMFHMLL